MAGIKDELAKKALPEVITPERFTRMALSALNTTQKLRECTQMSFLVALMNAAQLGYKGLIDLSYRNPQMQIISAQAVYDNGYILSCITGYKSRRNE